MKKETSFLDQLQVEGKEIAIPQVRERWVSRIIVIAGTGQGMQLDQMTQETMDALETKQKLDIDYNRPAVEVCEEKIYRDEDGNYCIPAQNLFAALKYAGAAFPYEGRKKISTKTTTFLPSLLKFNQNSYKIVTPEGQGWIVDRHLAKIPEKNIPVPVKRPLFRQWALIIDAEINIGDKVSEETMQRLFMEAGKISGLGAMRPNKGNPYGMFKLVKWVDPSKTN